jgi:hypothetical protein
METRFLFSNLPIPGTKEGRGYPGAPADLPATTA